ncbi:hypothetical protein OAK75_10765 [Bacteriovoracales bacterium]|nr:hypothetical protein [Bacteriovoracales bacterium]
MLKNIIFIFFFFNCSYIFGKELLIVYPSGAKSPLLSYSKKVLIELYKRIGISLKLKGYHASRSLVMANLGKADGELLRIKGINKIFKNLIRIESHLLTLTIKAITLKKDLKTIGLPELHKHTISFHRGYVIFHKIFKNHKASQPVTDSTQIYRMVNNNRVRFGLIVEELSGRTLKKGIYHKIKKIDVKIPPVDLYHYINKKHISLVPKLLKAIKEMKQERFFQKIQKAIP